MPIQAESDRRTLIAADRETDRDSLKVPCVTLAELLDRYKLRQLDLLKMDIEGSEWEVLHSTPPSVLRSIRRIQFEYHEVNARFGYSRDRLFEYLRSTGYRVAHCQQDSQGTGIAVVEQG